MTLHESRMGSLGMLVTYVIFRAVKANCISHIITCSRYQYSGVALILCICLREGSLDFSSSSSLMDFSGDLSVALTSLSRKRDRVFSAY